MSRYLFTSESVTEGHPDKLCDQISDSILDKYIAIDPNARVACEVSVTTDLVVVMGEVTSTIEVNIEKVVRDTIREIGYNKDEYGFNADTCEVIIRVHEQSPDIKRGVDSACDSEMELGAGDQGMMFGFACDETDEYMPLPIVLAHRLTARLANVRKKGLLRYLRPDGKAQVTVEYDEFGPQRIDTIVISTQHDPEIPDYEDFRNEIIQAVIRSEIPHGLMDANTKIYINPTGSFVIGGPAGDTGLTGRKIIVDTYGGYARHGGGAFSGKDPTKVDRSAAYMARHVAKSIVAGKLARKCEIQVAYAIGKAAPVSIYINTFGTGIMSDEKLARIISLNFDFQPGSIIKYLRLRNPIYKQTAAYGHFRDANFISNIDRFPWEICSVINLNIESPTVSE